MKRQRAIVLGKGRASIRAAELLHGSDAYALACVVPAVPEPLRHALGQWGLEQGIPVVGSGRTEDVAFLLDDSWTADLLVSVYYNRIIAPEVLARCGRAINLHPSPLPRYRGVLPIKQRRA